MMIHGLIFLYTTPAISDSFKLPYTPRFKNTSITVTGRLRLNTSSPSVSMCSQCLHHPLKASYRGVARNKCGRKVVLKWPGAGSRGSRGLPTTASVTSLIAMGGQGGMRDSFQVWGGMGASFTIGKSWEITNSFHAIPARTSFLSQFSTKNLDSSTSSTGSIVSIAVVVPVWSKSDRHAAVLSWPMAAGNQSSYPRDSYKPQKI